MVPDVTVDLHVTRHGEGDPIVLIPGLGYASWFWQGQEPLAESHLLMAVDPRGAGQSPKPDGPYTIDRMAIDVAEVIAGAGGPAHVVGHSMGGYIAQSLALARPDLVRSLTLVSTTCGGPRHLPVPEATLTAWLKETHRPPAEYARATMHLSLRPGWTDEHPTKYDDLLRRRLEHPTPTEAWQHQFAACEAFLNDGADVGSITAPTLVVHGDADRVVPIGNAHLLTEVIPGARLALFEGAGHLVSIESPASFNETLSAFWQAVDTGEGS